MTGTPTYQFLSLAPRTLTFTGEIRPQDILRARWTRRDLEPGSFEITVPRLKYADTAGLATIAEHQVLRVLRDGVVEFEGVIQKRVLDRLANTWVLSGPDLLGFFLRRRVVGATAAVAKSGAAETVAKAYVDENGGPSTSDATRKFSAELTALTFTVATSGGSGATVDYNARRQYLDQVVANVLREGDLNHKLTIDTDLGGYTYATFAVVDRTVGTGGTPLSVGWDNVEALTYIENLSSVINFLYVAGDGSGDARNVTEVSDASSIATDFRREGVIDARYADTAQRRTDFGNAELARQLEIARSVSVQPLRSSANARYRTDWDVGDDITVAIPAVSVELDRRVVAAIVELARGSGETVSMEVGVFKATSALRRMEKAFERLQAAAFE